MNDGWEVGARVIRQNRYGYGAEASIAKIYKNGNFVLDGETQQYRSWGRDGHAMSTGRGYDSVRLLTDEVREEIKRELARNEALKAARDLSYALNRISADKALTLADDIAALATKVAP